MAPGKKMPAVAEQVQAELQDYLNVKGVNALFVAIVEGLLIEKPVNPIAFIIEFLCKSYPDLAVQARIPELLQAQRADLDRQAAEERARLGQGIDDDDMSDDEEQMLDLNGGRRGGVSSGSMGSLPPPTMNKTDEQIEAILDIIAQNGFLRQLDEKVHEELVDQVTLLEVDAGEVVISEGQPAAEADKFYLIQDGSIQVLQQGGNGAVAKELSRGDSFGELALLHGAAREANFVAKTPCTLWVLHRDAYRVCVMRATEARRTRYKDFLRGVTCLRAMSDYDCLALADASEEVEVPLGETAYTQGDPEAHRLCVILKGEASAFMVDASGKEREVARLKKGDHYMEDPSSATETPSIRAVGGGRQALVLLRLEADVFLRLAGSLLTVAGLEPPDGLKDAVNLTSQPTPQISAAQRASWEE